MNLAVIWISYTTRYRDGGDKFERAAMTLRNELLAQRFGCEVRCEPVESKRDFVAAVRRFVDEGISIDELHFIGHSGMYGIMFGTTEWPEQFSPHEWRQLEIPFSTGATAWFHACRSARWFAPFFARTFGVRAFGHHLYTTVSRSPTAYKWDRLAGPDDPLYIISCAGRKSHGFLGAVAKHSGLVHVEPMRGFMPSDTAGEDTYDGVADLYDEAFADITVREDEWRWLIDHLPTSGSLRLLDIGCGNGALLRSLSDRIQEGTGVDRSASMIELARRRSADHANLKYHVVDGPELPAADSSIDVVVSFMSFRYLDWDPMMNEIRRVLVPGGRLLIIDMAASPLKLRELPAFVRSKFAVIRSRRSHPQFSAALQRLVRDPRWLRMLSYNPIRAEHEYRWYLHSRYPGHSIEVLNVGYTERLLAFDSGPLEPGVVPPLTYP